MLFRAADLPEDLPAIHELLSTAERTDGRPALSEHKSSRLSTREEVARTVGFDATQMVVYGQADLHPSAETEPVGHWATEIVIHPDFRGLPTAVKAIRACSQMVPRTAAASLWAWHGELITAAETLELREIRRIIQLERPLPLPLSGEVAGRLVRGFRRGEDEGELLRVNNAAFAGHRENAAMDSAALAVRMEQGWFDPKGLLLAEEGGRIAGFCWTKLHPGDVGEIYIIGVEPAAQNRGLGRLLTQAGLDHLYRERGAKRAMLWADADNEVGLHLYQSMGFASVFVSREYELT